MNNLNKLRASFLITAALALSTAAFAQPLNGSYTIGGSSPSYSTITAAVTDLNTKGISGPVIFNIRNGSYSERTQINTITGASAVNTVTFKSETNNAANVMITANATGTANNYVLKLANASYIRLKDISLKNGGTTYGRALVLEGTASNDSIVNCKLESPVRTTASANTAVLFADPLTGSNNVFKGNTFLNGSYGIYYSGTNTTNLANGGVFIGNTIQNQYTYATYFYYTDNLKFINNTITTNSTDNLYYGIRVYYGDGAQEIVGNKISGGLGGYGMYLYYNDADPANKGIVANNIVTIGSATNTANGIRSYYSSNQRIYNNSVNITSTSATAGYAGYFYYSSATYEGNEIRNNVFSNTGGGYAMFVYNPTYNNSWDYNNLYTSGANLVDRGTPAKDYTTLTEWRADHGHDLNSISYNPGFTSTTNLVPDAANPASWSLNGRGIHITGNNKDFNGNTRVTDLGSGVPDIGAYEFTPTSTPPVAAVTPATPVAGGTQTFTFGEDTVATIQWAPASTVPGSITVRQYTGTVPSGLSSISTSYMYFYTDISTPAGTYDHTTDIYYKEPWLGTTAAETALRLARKNAAGTWIGYSPAVSAPNTDRNFIHTPGLTGFGSFTGIDVSNNAGISEITEPTGYICAGTYPVKVRVKNNGSNTINNVKISWTIDGVAQTAVDYTTPIAVQGDAIVTLGNIALAGKPKTIKVWTSLPNGVADPVEADDTVNSQVSSGLNGVFTVGGTSPDYPGITEAVNDMNTYGICGPVTFNIRNGNYTGQAQLNKINGMSAANRITFQAENNTAPNVNISFAATAATNNYVLSLNDASFVTVKDINFKNTGTDFGRVIVLTDGASNDSFVNCTFEGPVRTVASSNTSLLFADPLTGRDNIFNNNTFLNGSYGLYYSGTSTTVKTDGGVFTNNKFLNQFTYATYFYYTDNLKFNNNTINTNSTDNLYYGIRVYYGDGAQEIVGNKISGALGGYGMYLYYNDGDGTNKGLVANNIVSIGSATNTANGIRSYYSSNQRIYNNSVNITSNSTTAGYAGYFYYSSATYINNEIYNNVFSNTGGGYALFVYNPTYNNKWDYNNLYTTGPKLVDRGTPAAEYDNLSQWRAASNHEMNSISYNPGFTSATILVPDPTNAASWSLNGRGIHITGNDKDINGNTRVTSRVSGVPDIGAYEFTPVVAPPDAKAEPATAAPGTKQYYLFGEDTVATINWSNALKLTSPLSVKQYTGTIPPQLQAVSGGNHMYTYTAINDGLGRTYSFDAELYYKDAWLGTMAGENKLRMAHKADSAWIAYDATSTVDITRNFIKATDLNRLGYFTGIDSGTIFSAYITASGSTVICTGGNVVLNANTGQGYAYQWFKDGAAIPGATAQSYTATTRGDYTVYIRAGHLAARSASVTITDVAPPMAQINASGAVVYCPGSNLVLNATQGNGLTYQWQLNGADIPGAINDNYAIAAQGTYRVKVSNIGCEAISSPVVVTGGPLRVDLGNDTGFCAKQNKPFILDAGYAGARYSWSTGDTTQTISLPNTTGTYWVEVDAGGSCVDRDTVFVQIDPVASVNGINYVQSGNTYQFSPAGASNVSRYLWIFDRNGVITTSTDEKPAPQQYTQSMNVKLIVSNDCGTDTAELVNWTTSVNDVNTDAPGMTVYPNPSTNGYVTLDITGDAYITDVIIVSNTGNVVYKESLQNRTKTLKVDANSFAAGNYIIRVHTDKGPIAKPLSIIR